MDLVRTDLHGHSHHSDGRASPAELVTHRVRHGFDVIALTDHDTFRGVAEAHAALRALAADAASPLSRRARELADSGALVPAMEATSFIHFGTDRAEQVHVLAYFPPAFLDDDAARLRRTRLWARGERVHAAWRSYVLDFVRREDDDVRAALGEDELRALDDDAFPQLQSFILRIPARLPEATHGARAHEVFKSFQLDHVHFWDDAALFGWSPEELIDAIRSDGGLDIVAHPVRVRDQRRLDDVIRHASGLEAYTSRHAPAVAARFRARAEELGKHWTASTDDHQHRPYVAPASGTPRQTVDAIRRGAG